MRVVFSGSCSLWLTREAVLLARELGAAWATCKHIPILGEENCWLKGRTRDETYGLPSLVPRHDPVLLALHERLGAAMSDDPVFVADVPDEVVYSVSSYNNEDIVEVHRMWNHYAPEGAMSETVYCFSKDTTFEELQRRYGRT